MFKKKLKLNIQYKIIKDKSYNDIEKMIINVIWINNQRYNLQQMWKKNTYITNTIKIKKFKDSYEFIFIKLNIIRKINNNDKK